MTPHLAGTPRLETERLVLRGPEGPDWEGWARLALSERAQHIGGPYSRETAFRAWGHVIGHWAMRGFGSFVITRKDTGQAIGHCGPWFPEGWPEHELGWTIWSREDEGQGYAFEAASAARDHAFHTLGWRTAVSYIDDGNLRSIALARRLGATQDETAPKPDHDAPPILVFRHAHAASRP